MAEWFKATVLKAVVFHTVGSNPTPFFSNYTLNQNERIIKNKIPFEF